MTRYAPLSEQEQHTTGVAQMSTDTLLTTIDTPAGPATITRVEIPRPFASGSTVAIEVEVNGNRATCNTAIQLATLIASLNR